MASVFSSLSKALVTTFDTIGDVGNAVQKSVGMATNYIDRQATSADIVGLDTVILSTTLELEKIGAELDGNEKRRDLFKMVAGRFNREGDVDTDYAFGKTKAPAAKAAK